MLCDWALQTVVSHEGLLCVISVYISEIEIRRDQQESEGGTVKESEYGPDLFHRLLVNELLTCALSFQTDASHVVVLY